ncbi:MAG: twin-arginine translocase subunit TatC, partial [Methylobacter sp.]
MSQNNVNEDGEQSFISHLIELRNRVLRAVLCVLVVFLALASYANEIYSMLAGPLLQHMPKNSTMIAIDVASPFFTPFKLVLILSVFISVPFIL